MRPLLPRSLRWAVLKGRSHYLSLRRFHRYLHRSDVGPHGADLDAIRFKLKLLRWDNNGFWLYYRRLEKGRFEWPSASPDERKSHPITRRQLGWLLDGLPLEQRRAHGAVTSRIIV